VRYTVFEQGLYRVRDTPNSSEPCFSRQAASTLSDLTGRFGGRLSTWQGPDSLRFHQYVGVVRQGDLIVEILPKLESLPVPAQVRRVLLAMLADTYNLDVQSSALVDYLQSDEPFSAALARLYCYRLAEAVRRGLRQDYQLCEEHLAYIRGKVDWATYTKALVSQRLEFPCAFDERSEDTTLNRVLKAALLRASALLERGHATSVMTELRHALHAVTDVQPSAQTLSRITTDRMSRHLAPLLSLAKLILRDASPDERETTRAQNSTYALAWDMNVLFEEYIAVATTRAIGARDCNVISQDVGKHLATMLPKGSPAFPLKPDIVVRYRASRAIVADTKWKQLDATSSSLGVSPADIYQLLAYATRFQAERTYLIYPHHPALGLPGLKREFEIGNGVRVGVATVDLSRLAEIGGALQNLFGAEAVAAAS
jgi:5-methylcytosine-specific restriction enzyme subunit McrC